MLTLPLYLNDKKVTRYDLEKVNYDISNTLYEAQIEGRDCKEVIGDYRLFCDTLLKEVPKLSKRWLYLKRLSWITLCIALSLCYAYLTTFFNLGFINVLNVRVYHVSFLFVLLFQLIIGALFIRKHLFNKPELYFIVLNIPLWLYFLLHWFYLDSYNWQFILFEIDLLPFIVIELILFGMFKYVDDRV